MLRTLAAMGSLHGYGIARRIEQLSEDTVVLNQGTIYVSLVRLETRGWIKLKWGTSDNRRAKFDPSRGLARSSSAETDQWERLAAMVGGVLAAGTT